LTDKLPDLGTIEAGLDREMTLVEPGELAARVFLQQALTSQLQLNLIK
jgi:hypothetical protein